ncbi:MAG: succinate dehydrogenase/fumarate reductase iron-sulfur subunit [Clostridia bacterium]
MADASTIRVWRGDASGGRFVDYEVPVAEGMTVLDALHRVQASEAHDLAVRWNCKAGKCGSCSAEINGRPALMCMTRLSGLARGEPVTVAPLKAFPIVRDLVTDVSFNYAKSAEIGAFQARQAGEAGLRTYQEDVDRLREFHNCIECFLCQDVCHVIRDHEESKARYSGPRFFVRLAALEMHPGDAGDRVGFAQRNAGIGYCNVTKCCSEVCPEGIRITDNAIIPMKERAADRFHDPLARFLGLFSNGRKDP